MHGDERLRHAVGRLGRRREPKRRPAVPRPEPESAWGWAVEDRLGRLEEQQRWVIRLVAGTLLAAVVQLGLKAAGIG
jgi:hypothetical protein